MKSIENAFDLAAPYYLQYADIQFYSALKLSLYMPHNFYGNIIEMGAGPGVFTQYLLPWKDSLVVTDLSEKMCLHGKKRYPSLNWKQMDACTPISGPWDLICSSSMLQWSVNPDKLFLQWRNVMAPDGYILGSLFIKGSLNQWYEAIGFNTSLIWRTEHYWQQTLNRSGLSIIKQETEIKEIFYPSAIDALKSIHYVGAPPVPRLGAGQLRRIINDYKQNFGSNLGIPVTWVIYRFLAQLK
jgi:SAM-dependent methyltransferase